MQQLQGLYGKFKREQQRHGLWYALRRTLSYAADPTRGHFNENYTYYASVRLTPDKSAYNQRPLKRHPRTALKINWVIPDMDPGNSGGHNTIYTLAQQLEQRGHDQHFYVFGKSKFKSSESFRAALREYRPINAPVTLLGSGPLEPAALRPCDALIATGWQTAYPVYETTNAARKFYFVQDFEPWFNAMSSLYVLAENTYRMGFMGITYGPWLATKLTRDYHMPAQAFRPGFDHAVYFAPTPGEQRDPNLVVHYARPVTPRRGWELSMNALRELKSLRPQTRIVLYGSDLAGITVPFAHEPVGVLTPRQLGALYRRASAGLVLSLTNHSSIPREMMACGCPVIDFKS
ncbi:MAG: hypothetical protein V1895_00115, partial [Parcubacteria group bacterium]